MGVHAFIWRLPDGRPCLCRPLGAPVLLCILANGAADAPTNQGGDLLLAWWSRNGRSHLVIGHVPEERAVTLAQMIEKQV